ncbi:protein of unknown function [Cyanobium sp. NIES-981]|nr:protein of unknown function [Cyanobium sp. NIES-981]
MLLPQSGRRLARQQLYTSSRKSPCPICGRIKDSDCRWSYDWISCHSGAAANHLQPGQTLMVDGLQWYLAAVEAGHSGCSHVYRPHTPRQRPQFTRNKLQAVTEEDLIVRLCRYFYRELRPREHASLRLPAWELCQPDVT